VKDKAERRGIGRAAPYFRRTESGRLRSRDAKGPDRGRGRVWVRECREWKKSGSLSVAPVAPRAFVNVVQMRGGFVSIGKLWDPAYKPVLS
jgi:hypothetical protein